MTLFFGLMFFVVLFVGSRLRLLLPRRRGGRLQRDRARLRDRHRHRHHRVLADGGAGDGGRAADRGAGDAVPGLVGDAARPRLFGESAASAADPRRRLEARAGSLTPVPAPRLDLRGPGRRRRGRDGRAPGRPDPGRHPARCCATARTASASWRPRSASARTTSATTWPGCATPGWCAPAATMATRAGSTTSATRTPSRRARAALADLLR